MQTLSDDERQSILGTVLVDELKAIHEYVKDIPGMKHDIGIMKEDIAELKSDMKTVKAVLKDHSRQLNKVDNLDERVTELEVVKG